MRNASWLPRDAPRTGSPMLQRASSRILPEVQPTPVFEADGSQAKNAFGVPIMRPSDVSLENVAKLGEWARTQPPDVQLYLLSKFVHGGEMDFQRRNGKFYKEYIDSATVAIGVFGAAMGWDIDKILQMQDFYGWAFSKFGNVPMSEDWKHLPKRNVENTRTGYRIYNSGAASGQ